MLNARLNLRLIILMKTLKYLLFVFVLFLPFSCAEPEEIAVDSGDSLSEDDNAFIESVSIPNPRLQDILSVDGSPLGRKSSGELEKALIDELLRNAQSL